MRLLRPSQLIDGMLNRANDVRLVCGVEPLHRLPLGLPGRNQKCPGWHSLDGLGLRPYEVGPKWLRISEHDCPTFEQAWPESRIIPNSMIPGQSLVSLPPEWQHFITVFDSAASIPAVFDYDAAEAEGIRLLVGV